MLGVWTDVDGLLSPPSNEAWKDDLRLAIIENKEEFNCQISEHSLANTLINCLNEELKNFDGNSVRVIEARFFFTEISYDNSLFKAELTYSDSSKRWVDNRTIVRLINKELELSGLKVECENIELDRVYAGQPEIFEEGVTVFSSYDLSTSWLRFYGKLIDF